MLLVPLRPGLTKMHKIHLPLNESLIAYVQQVLKFVQLQNLGSATMNLYFIGLGPGPVLGEWFQIDYQILVIVVKTLQILCY